MTEQLHFHFSLSCTGEGNGNPLQCSRLENPRDWGDWWAAVYGVAQSQTRLKRLSSRNSSILIASLYFTYGDLPFPPHNKRKKRKWFGIGRGLCEIKENFLHSCKRPPEEAGDF